MRSLRKFIPYAATVASVMGSMMFATATADAGTHHYYVGPYATQQECDAGRTAFHNPPEGQYTWPCEYAYRTSGAGWYFYYRVTDAEPDPCHHPYYCAPNSMPAR